MAFAILTAPISIEDPTLIKYGKTAEAITQGHVVRLTTTNTLEIANSAAANTADMVGVALQTVTAINQYVGYAPPGAVITTSGLTAGQSYLLGNAADEGKVGLFSDVDTANAYGTLVGLALSATRLLIIGRATGVAL